METNNCWSNKETAVPGRHLLSSISYFTVWKNSIMNVFKYFFWILGDVGQTYICPQNFFCFCYTDNQSALYQCLLFSAKIAPYPFF